MKKITILVLLLALLSVGSFCLIGNAITNNKANVTIKENVLYGDKSYAEGVTVLTKAHYDNHLFWNTSYTIGETPKISTDYEFSYSKVYNSRPFRQPNGIYLDIEFRYGFDLSIPEEESVGLQKAYRELYDATEPGTTGSKNIRLQDYYTYYPIQVAIDLPGTLWHGNDYHLLLDDDYKNERAVWDAFVDFFKIPIPADLPAIEISITKDMQGNGVGIGSAAMEKDFFLDPVTAYTSDMCFFSICNRYLTEEGSEIEYIDTSLIPGGYGIYGFSYKNVRNSSNTNGNSTTFYPEYETGVKADTLAMVYPLDQETQVVHIIANEDDNQLLLFTKEYDSTYLTVIDIASMAALQKIEVTNADQYIFYECDNCIVLNGMDYISVIEKLPGKAYQLAFTVPRMKEINDYNLTSRYTAMTFDGEKLVIIDSTTENTYGFIELCGFTTSIYTAAGLVFFGEYENSLSTAMDLNNYSFHCLPIQYDVN